MRAFLRELRFLLARRANIVAVVALTLLSSLGVGMGLHEVTLQKGAVERVVALQKTETAAIKIFAKEAGDAAYYRFHVTWDAPSPLAFAALGQRDIAPTMLRVRALALEGQIYENETGNPELALPGHFDFAFVLIYLAPLVMIALLHDLWSGEREAGRLSVLQAMPKSTTTIWLPRVAARFGLVFLALCIPFGVGAIISGVSFSSGFVFLSLIAAHLIFWTGLSLLIANRSWPSSTNAASLAAIWFVVTLIAPASANLAINATTPIPDGAAIMRENREAVHDAWDLDRPITLNHFYALYPEWSGSPPMKKPFEWKWYFAFQHLGDRQVGDMSRAYVNGIALRDAKAGAIAWALPPILIQRTLQHFARTDMAAGALYQNRIRAYHTKLRTYYYPFLFTDKAFTSANFDAVPEFKD